MGLWVPALFAIGRARGQSIACCGTPARGYVASGAPAAWQDLYAPPGNDSASSSSIYVVWAAIVANSSGTCTKVRMYVDSFTSGANMKLALYTNGGALLSGTPAVGVTGVGYCEGTLDTPQTVMNGTTYKVAYIVSGAGGTLYYDCRTGNIAWYGSCNYADFPPANLPSSTQSNQWYVGIYK